MKYLIVEYLWFFIIYAFLGWCVEVAFHVVTQAKFVNRGFLNGPMCPIYGFGMNILIFTLYPLIENPLLLFFGSFLLTSILEYITGFILEKIFDDKWWDYSELPFNINGYIALSFSTMWGLGGVFILEIIHQPIFKLVSILNNKIGNIILSLLFLILIIDFIITILGIMKIKKRILLLNSIEEELNIFSEDIGGKIYKGMTTAIKTKDIIGHQLDELEYSKPKLKLDINEKKQYISNLNKKYKKILKDKGLVHKRLEKSFPNLKKRLANLDYKKK